MKEKIVRLEECSYTYEGAKSPAVNRVTLQVREGEFLAILGRNGSGKSTLAKLINGLYQAQEGKITVCGMNPAVEEELWEIRRNAGMVFQNPDNQLVATIVEEDVAFGPENLGIPSAEIRKRVDEALKAVNMSEFALQAPHKLSGGQKQRVAIAGMLAMHPRLLIFDEATAMLDPIGRKDILQTALRLNREEGITILWITHYMEEAAQADWLVVMNSGEIALQGTPREVFSQPEQVEKFGLDVPPAASLSAYLNDHGMEMPRGLLTEEEVVEALCQLLSKN